jgi:hypothetical protein
MSGVISMALSDMATYDWGVTCKALEVEKIRADSG